MKTLIIRKPRFMREDGSMKLYTEIAMGIIEQINRPETPWLERYELMKRLEEHLDKAATSGGFFNTKDFLRWMDEQNTTT